MAGVVVVANRARFPVSQRLVAAIAVRVAGISPCGRMGRCWWYRLMARSTLVTNGTVGICDGQMAGVAMVVCGITPARRVSPGRRHGLMAHRALVADGTVGAG